jgi:DNA repair protein RecO (recombination protein O)
MSRVRLYSAEALVLRGYDYGEADRLLTLLTRQHGKVRALARGVRRPTSRHSGNLELFCHVQLQLARGRELDIATQPQLLTPFRRLREHLASASQAFFLAEVTDALLEPADPAERVFKLLLSAFSLLDSGTIPTLLGPHYLLKLLDALGYRPELFACLGCSAALQPEENYVSPWQGGALCPRCGPLQAGAAPVAVNLLKVMRHLQSTQTLGGLDLALPSGLADQVDLQVRAFAEHHLNRQLRSPAIIRQLRRIDGAGLVEIATTPPPAAGRAGAGG